MGAATKHRQKFLRQHPVCAFCGGHRPATTIEHCPPRSMFQHRLWPEGFEFPACETCNRGTADDDALIALVARLDPISDRGDEDGRFASLVWQVNQRFPRLFRDMQPSATEARRMNRENGITPPPGRLHQEVYSRQIVGREAGGREMHAVRVPIEIHDAVCTFARKLGKALFYLHCGRIFPDDGCLIMNWFSNEQLVADGEYQMFSLLQQLTGVMPEIKRQGQYLHDQFGFKITTSEDGELMVIQAKFGNAFGLVLIAGSVAGQVEGMVQRLRDKTGNSGPFTILQSSIL